MATIKDKIGLAMLPSAQSGGASTDITDFSGTVHSLLPIQYESPNLLTNGGFDQDSIWQKGTGWSIGGGKASFDGSTGFQQLQQIDVTEKNKNYKLTFNLSNVGSSVYRLRLISGGSYNKEIAVNGNGTYVTYFISNTGSSDTFGIQNDNNTGDSYAFDIDDVKLQLVSNGDFDFERSSSATRVGSDGYIKNVEVLSDELVQNGDFEQIGSELVTYSDFNYGSGGWSLVDGKWVFDDVAAGYINHTSISVTVGQIYKVVVDVSVPSGVANFRFTSGNGQTILFDYTNFSDGVTTFYATVTGVNGGLQRLFAPTTLSDAFTLNSISIKEVGQNWHLEAYNFFNIVEENGNKKLRIEATGSGYFYHTGNVIVSGKKYRLNFDISNYSGFGSLKFQSGGVDTGFIYNSNGSYIYEFEATSSGNVFFRTGGTPFIGTLDNVSVVEVTDDTDIPRLDFSNAAQPSLLLEPERSNLIRYSEDLSTYGQTKCSVSLSEDLNPANGKSYKLVEDTQSGSHFISPSLSGVSTTVESTFSIFAKAGEKNFVALWNNAANTYFDLSNGTIGTVAANTTAKIEPYPNGWYRCSITYISSSIHGNVAISISAGSTTGSENYVGSSESIYIYGVQFETGSYPTSYIPTNGETNGVTRSADVCNNAGDSTIFNDAEGVLFVDVKRPNDTSDYNLISINDGLTGGSQNYVGLGFNITTGNFYFNVRLGGTSVISDTTLTSESDVFYKIAIKYKSGDSSVWINGQEYLPSTTTFSNANLLDLEFSWFTNLHNFKGNCRQLLYFNEALTDAELERLTSSDITQVLRNYNRRGELLGATYESTHVQTKLNELF